MRDKKKADDLRLMPERAFGKMVTAITRVPKAKSGPLKPKRKKRKSR